MLWSNLFRRIYSARWLRSDKQFTIRVVVKSLCKATETMLKIWLLIWFEVDTLLSFSFVMPLGKTSTINETSPCDTLSHFLVQINRVHDIPTTPSMVLHFIAIGAPFLYFSSCFFASMCVVRCFFTISNNLILIV